MKIETSELTGPALDWAVAMAQNVDYHYPDTGPAEPAYSTDWSLAGPIIERMEIGIKRHAPGLIGREWEASPSITAKGAGGRWGYGPTPLIAAMRCFVASKLGDEVEIPDELGQPSHTK